MLNETINRQEADALARHIQVFGQLTDIRVLELKSSYRYASFTNEADIGHLILNLVVVIIVHSCVHLAYQLNFF